MPTTIDKELLEFSLEHSPLAIYWVDKNAKIIYLNNAACKLLGYSKEELTGSAISQINPEVSIKSFKEQFEQLKQAKVAETNTIQLTKSGVELPMKITSYLVFSEGEWYCCNYLGDSSDITAIAGLDILSEGVWDWNLAREEIIYSAQWVSSFDAVSEAKSHLEVLGGLVHPHDQKMVKTRMQDCLNGKEEVYKAKFRLRDKSGNWRWVRDKGRIVSKDAEGKPLRMIGTTQDVTDIIEAEIKLRLSQEKLLKSSKKSLDEIRSKFLNIFNESNDAIFIGNPESNQLVDVNPKVCELLGYSRKELLNLPIHEIIPGQRKVFVDFVNKVKNKKSATTDKLVFKSKTGDRILVNLSASVFSLEGESGILGIVHAETDEGKFERIIGKVTEAAILNPEGGIVGSFIAETCRVLNVKYAGMSRIVNEDPLTVKLLNFWDTNAFRKGITYEVKGSPCEHVVGGDFQAFQQGIRQKFPDSPLWEYIKNAESYLAVPISDSNKNPVGHFFLCDEKSFERKSWIENLMRLGALRMRLELERLDAQQAIKEMNINLEKKVEERTKELSKTNLELENAIKEVKELRDKLEAENVYLKEEIKLNNNFEEIISQDENFKEVLKSVEKVAKTDSTVLILGETGTGKEVLTRSIHSISNRKDKPLVKVNCAALPASLIESELFGHEKGAYTGAVSSKSGRFELAHEGTLFLDEVGEIPIELQPKLLRALQEGEFERLGGVKTIKVDVRVIAATNRDLEKGIEKGEFRSDLYYRLNVFPISVPPLRERKKDIPLLINHFINKYNQKIGGEVSRVPQSVINQLMEYSWPGNIRELENIIERGVIISEGKTLRIGNWLKGEAETTDSEFKPLEQFEKEYIIKVLKSTDWKVSGKNGAAAILKMKPTTLESRIKKLGITKK